VVVIGLVTLVDEVGLDYQASKLKFLLPAGSRWKPDSGISAGSVNELHVFFHLCPKKKKKKRAPCTIRHT
jgi:hypothetical protein